MQQKSISPHALVCIAARETLSLLATWEKHWHLRQQPLLLSNWSERALLLGVNRCQQIRIPIDPIEVILFLASTNLFANEKYCQFIDHARENQQTRHVKIIPLLGRPVGWHESLLGALAALSANAIPVMRWEKSLEVHCTGMPAFNRFQKNSSAQRPPTPQGTTDYSDWGKLLRLLKRDYAEEPKTSQEDQLELDLHEHPSIILMDIEHHRPDHSKQALPMGTPILQVKDFTLWTMMGKVSLVTTRGLKALFTTLKENVRVILLNTCSSREQVQELIEVVDYIIRMNKRPPSSLLPPFYTNQGNPAFK